LAALSQYPLGDIDRGGIVPISNAGRPRTFEMPTPAAWFSRRDISDRASAEAALARLPSDIELRISPAADADLVRARKTRHNSRAATRATRRLPCRQEVGVC
jgi:hypothetical protein